MRKDDHSKTGYESRELDLQVGLMKGSEVIKIGTASLVLDGDENGSLQLLSIFTKKVKTNPVRNKSKTTNKPIKTSKSQIVTAATKSVSFLTDPSRKYTLQRSVLRVSIDAHHNYEKSLRNISSSMTLPLSIGSNNYMSSVSEGPTDSVENSSSYISHLSTDIDSDGSVGLNTLMQNDESSFDMVGYNCTGDDLVSTEDSDYLREDISSDYTDEEFDSFSDQESALLDEISLGSIKFKGIDAADTHDLLTT